MSLKEQEAYKAWADGVKAKLPDELKGNFDVLLTHEASKEIFGGHLREADYYRRLNELNTVRKETEEQANAYERDRTALWEWWNEANPQTEAALQERDRLKAELDAVRNALEDNGMPVNTPPPSDANPSDSALRQEIATLKQQLQNVDQALPKILGEWGSVLHRATKEGFEINPQEIVNHSAKNGMPLSQAYEYMTATARSEKLGKEREAEIAKAREEGRREALSNYPPPDRLKPSGPTIMEQAKDIPDNRNDRVAGAIGAFLELQQTA